MLLRSFWSCRCRRDRGSCRIYQKRGLEGKSCNLTFCLAKALCSGYDIDQIGAIFVKWYYQDYCTSTGHVIDIGVGTREAFYLIKHGTKAELAGGTDLRGRRVLSCNIHVDELNSCPNDKAHSVSS